MKKSAFLTLGVPWLLLLSIVLGCSGYGKVRYDRIDQESVVIDNLIENWNDYYIYYAGYAPDNPSGILFDPKNDGKNLKPSDRWMKIESRDTASEVMSWIRMQTDMPGWTPGLYQILGPDGAFYGYLYSVWTHLVAKVIDENTMYVLDLPPPPHYYGPGAEIRQGGPA